MRLPTAAASTSAFVWRLQSSRRERLQDETRRRAPRDCRACGALPDRTTTDASRPAGSADVEPRGRHLCGCPAAGDSRGAQLGGGGGSALGLRVGQVIVKLFFGGVESAPAALNARTSNAYLPGLRCL